jgi:hypothetical protein
VVFLRLEETISQQLVSISTLSIGVCINLLLGEQKPCGYPIDVISTDTSHVGIFHSLKNRTRGNCYLARINCFEKPQGRKPITEMVPTS